MKDVTDKPELDANRAVRLTDEEATVLLQLIDMAVKAGGLNVAEVAVVLMKRIQEAKPING